MTQASVRLAFSRAACVTLGSGSSNRAVATRADARRASEILSPTETDSNRVSSASSAAFLMSAGARGASASCIRSKVKSWRPRGRETWRGVRGCCETASFSLRLFITLLFLPSCSRTSGGKSRRFSRARASSSSRAGSETAAFSTWTVALLRASSTGRAKAASVARDSVRVESSDGMGLLRGAKRERRIQIAGWARAPLRAMASAPFTGSITAGLSVALGYSE